MEHKTVTLVPMTEDEFEAFLQWAIPDYAQDHIRTGAWPESEALRRSEEQHRELLPEGLESPGQYLLTIHDPASSRNVGMLWFYLAHDRPGKPAFLYQFMIHEEFRRQGYGLAALQALEDRLRDMGGSTIHLHVFGHNAPARALYEKAGYEVTNVNMAKSVAASTDPDPGTERG
jgi:ribosomal protein S18 acetylase RimI-like enzyme